MAVIAVFDFHGDSEALAAAYDDVLRKVVAISSGRPIVHLAVPREYGFMVIDVWGSEEALHAFEENPDLQRVLAESGLPEYTLRIYPVHNLGWPVDVMPMYR
jgi:quinol monooxygenase YgiN